MIKKVLIAIVILISGLGVQSQTEKIEKENNGHNIGGYVGASSGYGISYRYFPNRVGIQITTTPVVGSDDSHLSLGGMLLISLNKTKYTNLFGYLGYHYKYTKEEYDDEYSDYYYSNVGKFSSTGIGVGFELNVGNRVGFNWHLGYAYYTEENEYSDMEDTSNWFTFIDGGTGIFYKF